MMSTLYTVGHSTRSADEFLHLLLMHGIERLVDVRSFPSSRRYPHFGAEALAAALRDAGIEYVHERDLGGRRPTRSDSPNTHWRHAGFRGYADHLASPQFRAALERLIALAEERRTAIMCAEAVPWRCHRQLIADVLVARGWEVRHILSATKLDLHRLNPQARLQPDGSLIYPAQQQELFRE